MVGGGPNGLYAALLLLESCQNSFVHVIEKRGVHRPQVIRLPFSAIDVVPEKIKRALWPDARVRKAIFSEVNFWKLHLSIKINFYFQPALKIRSWILAEVRLQIFSIRAGWGVSKDYQRLHRN